MFRRFLREVFDWDTFSCFYSCRLNCTGTCTSLVTHSIDLVKIPDRRLGIGSLSHETAPLPRTVASDILLLMVLHGNIRDHGYGPDPAAFETPVHP